MLRGLELCGSGLAGKRGGARIGMGKLAIRKETSEAEEMNRVCPSG
jgi:hypothetical protein